MFGPRRWIEGAWSYRPTPQDDELATSFLARSAEGMGMAPITFLNALFGSSRSLLNQDLDAYMPEAVILRVAEGSGLPRERIAAMTLADTAGRLNLAHLPKARKTWILPTTVDANTRRRAGLQYCPTCLREDGRPHLRRRWRLGFVTTCTRHAIVLRDRCPDCESPLHIHRAPSIRHCHRCGRDLGGAGAERADGAATAFQTRLETALSDGYATLAGAPIASPLFFILLRRLCGLVVNGRHAAELRGALTSAHGGDPAAFDREHDRVPLEYMSTAERHRMLGLARRLIEDYPHRMVVACLATRIRRSYVVKDMAYVPFALDEALKRHLDDAPYHASDDEVAATAAWLRKTLGRASYANLKAHCGEARAAIYRHMDYERRPAKPSRFRPAGRTERP